MRGHRRLRPVLVAAALVATTCLGCVGNNSAAIDPPRRTEDPVARPIHLGPDSRVLMLGDSITWQVCRGNLQQFGAPAGDFARHDGGCYGWPGASSSDMRWLITDPAHAVRADSGTRPDPPPRYDLHERIRDADVLVIALGTNDTVREARTQYDENAWPTGDGQAWQQNPLHQPVDNGAFRDQIDWYMRQADGKPVLWPNIGVRWGHLYVNHLFVNEAKTYNAALEQAAQDWPNLHILDWAAIVKADAGHDNWIKNEVHVTKTGETQRWQLIIDGYNQLAGNP